MENAMTENEMRTIIVLTKSRIFYWDNKFAQTSLLYCYISAIGSKYESIPCLIGFQFESSPCREGMQELEMMSTLLECLCWISFFSLLHKHNPTIIMIVLYPYD